MTTGRKSARYAHDAAGGERRVKSRAGIAAVWTFAGLSAAGFALGLLAARLRLAVGDRRPASALDGVSLPPGRLRVPDRRRPDRDAPATQRRRLDPARLRSHGRHADPGGAVRRSPLSARPGLASRRSGGGLAGRLAGTDHAVRGRAAAAAAVPGRPPADASLAARRVACGHRPDRHDARAHAHGRRASARSRGASTTRSACCRLASTTPST